MFEIDQAHLRAKSSSAAAARAAPHSLDHPASLTPAFMSREDKALDCSTAWACGSLIARSIAMMPAKVMAPRSGDEADGAETCRITRCKACCTAKPTPN